MQDENDTDSPIPVPCADVQTHPMRTWRCYRPHSAKIARKDDDNDNVNNNDRRKIVAAIESQVGGRNEIETMEMIVQRWQALMVHIRDRSVKKAGPVNAQMDTAAAGDPPV